VSAYYEPIVGELDTHATTSFVNCTILGGTVSTMGDQTVMCCPSLLTIPQRIESPPSEQWLFNSVDHRYPFNDQMYKHHMIS
jgi:hypothetical protein